jgi:hypothetical protein
MYSTRYLQLFCRAATASAIGLHENQSVKSHSLRLRNAPTLGRRVTLNPSRVSAARAFPGGFLDYGCDQALIGFDPHAHHLQGV